MILFASDLDQTLIFSEKFNEMKKSTLDVETLAVIESINHEKSAFMHPIALTLLQEISSRILFIPATTRTILQFSRI